MWCENIDLEMNPEIHPIYVGLVTCPKCGAEVPEDDYPSHIYFCDG